MLQPLDSCNAVIHYIKWENKMKQNITIEKTDSDNLMSITSVSFRAIIVFISFLFLSPALLYGQWLDTTISVVANPRHLVFNSINNSIYAANWGATSVSVIDGETNNLITTIPIGSAPHSLCYNPINNKIYSANPYAIGANVSVIDGASNTVIATVLVGDYPYRPLHNPTDNKVYTANWTSNTVTIFDGATNNVITTITLGSPSALGPDDLGYNPTNNKVYCANWANNTVTIIDGATDNIIRTIPTGTYPRSIVHNPINNKVYWANSSSSSSSVSVIDGETDSVLATIPVTRVPYALTYNHINNKVYCANQWRDTVTVIDGETNSIIKTIPVGDEPSALFYNPTNNKIYCANSGTISSLSHTVTIIDGATDSVLTTIDVGDGPGAFAYNPEFNRVYVANYYGNSVSIIRDFQPEFTTSTASITFGTVPIGSSAQDSMVVVNTGAATLFIFDATSSDSNFSVSPSSVSISPSDSATFYITFAPSSSGAKSGYIIFVHNAPGSPDSVEVSGNGIISGVKNTDSIIPEFSLEQNYPNPFNPVTIIQYSVGSQEFVKLKVYDILGREITTLVNEAKPAGTYEVKFDASNLSTGIYIYKIYAGSFIETKKLILIK